MGRRLMIAGSGSGSGKTSVTCGLLRAFQNRGLRVSACKCGPDYIDPMFHREVLGVPSRNLDLFLCGNAAVTELLGESCGESDITVIEGVMGFYDGLAWTHTASSHELACVTQTPVLLVADCRGKALTLAAELQGLLNFLPNKIGGILLNRCSSRSYGMLKQLVERHTGTPVLGYLPSLPDVVFQSRHLGLVTAPEVEGLQEKVARLAAAMEQTIDLDAVVSLAAGASGFPAPKASVAEKEALRVAVARDKAFCFFYEDNLALLESLGAELVFFSPLSDACVPENISGMILPGGYPELYAGCLSGNRPMLQSIRSCVLGGMPTIAECGGYMLLCKSLVTAEQVSYPMAGVIDTVAAMGEKLSRFGYVTLTAQKDTLLCARGEQIRAHEFHYSDSQNPGDAFVAQKLNGSTWNCIYASETLHAGYPHIHLRGNEHAARRFLAQCAKYALSARRPEPK